MKRFMSLVALAVLSTNAFGSEKLENPYDADFDRTLKMLSSNVSETRVSGIERLSFMRAFDASENVVPFLKDPDAAVRREAAMNLGWTGNRDSLKPLFDALSDSDWTVRQSAAISLFNLTALDVEFDALANEAIREKQKQEFLPIFEADYAEKLLEKFEDLRATLPAESEYVYDLAAGKPVTVSSSARVGRTQHINCGKVRGWDAWFAAQNDKNPTVTIDMKKRYDFEKVVVVQNQSVLTKNLRVWISDDGENFKEIAHFPETKYRMEMPLKNSARFVRISASGSNSAKVPMHVASFEVWSALNKKDPEVPNETFFEAEKLVRAFRTFDYKPAISPIINALSRYAERVLPASGNHTEFYSSETWAIINRAERLYMQALIRTLGQLGGEKAETALIELMRVNKEHIFYCAEALGDCEA